MVPKFPTKRSPLARQRSRKLQSFGNFADGILTSFDTFSKMPMENGNLDWGRMGNSRDGRRSACQLKRKNEKLLLLLSPVLPGRRPLRNDLPTVISYDFFFKESGSARAIFTTPHFTPQYLFREHTSNIETKNELVRERRKTEISSSRRFDCLTLGPLHVPTSCPFQS